MNYYPKYAHNFSQNIKAVIETLALFPESHPFTGLQFQGYDILYKPYRSYLIFFVVQNNTIIIVRILKDRMDWQSILQKIQHLPLK